MKKVLIVVRSQQKGMMIALGKELSDRYEPVFVAQDENVRALVLRNLPGAVVELEPDFNVPREGDVLAQGLRYEERYGERLSMLCSYDRALGKGYLFNIDRYPDIGRSMWSAERKYAALINCFEYYEGLLEKHSPGLVMSLVVDKRLSLLTDKASVPYFGLGLVKYKNRQFWYDRPEYVSELYRERVRRRLEEYGEQARDEEVPYEQEVGSHYVNSRLRFSYKASLRQAARMIVAETSKHLRGLAKVDSYAYLGWLPSLFRKVSMFRYFERHGKRIGDLAGKRIVYFPLHLEPEIALLYVSPEFSNSMEMIAWISKALPADSVLVLKEHLTCLGMRSKRFYEMLRRIPNVVLAHPEETSWDWIEASSVVATITGTAAVEGVYFDTPVLSCGRHQIVNLLPTVRFANDYLSTREALNDLMAMPPSSELFHKAKWALYKAQLDVSFELPGYEKTYGGLKMETDMARIAVRALYSCYPELDS